MRQYPNHFSEREHAERLRVARALTGAELLRSRSRRAMRQRDVAVLAGISEDTYRSLERARSHHCDVNPTLDTLLRIAHVLDLDGVITGHLATASHAMQTHLVTRSDSDLRSALPTVDERIELLRHPPERA